MIIESKQTSVNFYKIVEGTDVNLINISYWLRDFFNKKLIPIREINQEQQ
jgi:hypothetical protein